MSYVPGQQGLEQGLEAVIVHVSPTAVSHHYYDLGAIENVVFLPWSTAFCFFQHWNCCVCGLKNNLAISWNNIRVLSNKIVYVSKR